MPELLLLDVDAATELHQTMTAVADEIDLDRGAIGRSLAGVERLVGRPADDPDPWLRDLADTLRREADDLARRLRMVIFGGPEINAGLLALDHIRANFATIDNRGGDGGDPDGIVSRDDLAWAVEHLDADTAAAAQWLLDHEDFFRAVETARGNDDYLAAGGTEFGSDGDGDGKFSLADVEAHFTKLDAWATLVPYMAAIDVAAHGGDHDGVMSRNDFESFLDDQDLPPEVRQAAQQVLDDGASHDTGGGLVSWGTLLDVASFIPIVGDVIDGATALYYLSQGEWEQAAMAGIGLIPIPGVSGGSVRASREVIKEVGETAAQRTARDAATEAIETGASRVPGISDEAASRADDVVRRIDAGLEPPPGVTMNGRTFRNDGRNDGEVLPRSLSDGTDVSYREWDVNPPGPAGRDATRVVTGSDGSAWYTDDHYRTFTQIRDGS